MGVLPICKLLFPNGSYRNGVCRALWAKIYVRFTNFRIIVLDRNSAQKLWIVDRHKVDKNEKLVFIFFFLARAGKKRKLLLCGMVAHFEVD